MNADDRRHAAAVDAVWDEVVRTGRATDTDRLDAHTVALIERLWVLSAPPQPAAARERVRQRLQREQGRRKTPVDLSTRAEFSAFPVAGRHGANGGPLTRPAARHRPVRWRSLMTLATTAAILVAVLAASLLALHGGWPGRSPQPSRFLTAPSELTATPATASLATVLWHINGGTDQPFEALGHQAIDPDGNLWVPDAKYGQFLIFAPDGTFLEAWGTPGSAAGAFDFTCIVDPYGGVAFDGVGNIYVVDSGNRRIQKFGPDRTFLTSWGSEGVGNDQFLCPVGIVVDLQGRVYVSDETAGKIAVFDRDGKWQATWSGLGSPLGMALDRGGNLWMADFDAGSIVQFAPDGQRLTTWTTYGREGGAMVDPTDVAVDGAGDVFVIELSGNRVQVLGPDGTLLGGWGKRGDGPGEFKELRGIVLDGQGHIYVSEWEGTRVQKFQLVPPLGQTAATGTPEPT